MLSSFSETIANNRRQLRMQSVTSGFSDRVSAQFCVRVVPAIGQADPPQYAGNGFGD
jgi:hypothetical protein